MTKKTNNCSNTNSIINIFIYKNEIYKGNAINFGNYGSETIEANSSEEGYVSLYTNLNNEYKYETNTKMNNIKYLKISKLSYNTTNYYIELN